jgi:cell division transport system ATP-binding protein
MEQEINTDAIIRLRDVDIYQKKQLVLSHVSFEINQAEFVYLVGKTGCGKSSLLKTMYCALPLKKGEMYIMEYDIPTIKKRDIPYLRRKIGIIFQDFQLLTDRNIKDNLIFVMRATGWKDKVKMNTRIEEVLALVGLETKDYKMPFELSGGEQQRVSIARALLNNPGIIIADEPTGNLDPDTSLEIVKLLKDISRKGTSVLMATHDFYMIDKLPGRIMRIENNTINDLGLSLH